MLYPTDGNVNVIITEENSLAVSEKVKHRFTAWHSIFTSSHMPKRNKQKVYTKAWTEMLIITL